MGLAEAEEVTLDREGVEGVEVAYRPLDGALLVDVVDEPGGVLCCSLLFSVVLWSGLPAIHYGDSHCGESCIGAQGTIVVGQGGNAADLAEGGAGAHCQGTR